MYQELFSLSTDLMVILDTGGCVVEANPAFLQLLGKSLHEVKGQAMARFIVDTDKEILQGAIQRMTSGSPSEQVEIGCLACESGAARCEYTLLPSACGENILAIGDTLDAIHLPCATKQEMERLVDERTRDLKLANAQLEAFNFSLVRDLSAPLRAIKGFSRAIIEDYGDRLDSIGRDYLQRIHANSERMTMLTSYLLQLSRLGRQAVSSAPKT